MSHVLIAKMNGRIVSRHILSINNIMRVQAQHKLSYEVIDGETGNLVKNVKVKAIEKNLLLEVDGQTVAVIDNFFDSNFDTAYLTDNGLLHNSEDVLSLTAPPAPPSEAGAGAATAATAVASSGSSFPTLGLAAAGIVGGGAAITSTSSNSGSTESNTQSNSNENNTNTDLTAPTLIISNNAVGTVNTLTGNVIFTFTFSESVTGFEVSDITLSGGTAATFTEVNGSVYTLEVTPDANSTADITVDVAANSANDLAGNGNVAAAQDVVNVDTQAPTVTITNNSVGTVNSLFGDVTFTFTFSEDVTGFDASDITLTGGTAGLFTAVSATNYTLVVTPDASSTADITVDVAANRANDLAGNGNVAAAQDVVNVDTLLPTAVIGLSDTVINWGETSTVTITFSEAVNNFTLGDLTAPNGTLSALNTADNITWTATFTPNVAIDDTTNMISLANTYNDAAGNPGTVANSANYDVVTDFADVVFDLTDGNSTSYYGTNRSFETGVAYDIYIKVDSDFSFITFDPAQRWINAGDLGADDSITLVGDGNSVTPDLVLGAFNNPVSVTTVALSVIQWRSALAPAVRLGPLSGNVTRSMLGISIVPSIWTGFVSFPLLGSVSYNVFLPTSVADP